MEKEKMMDVTTIIAGTVVRKVQFITLSQSKFLGFGIQVYTLFRDRRNWWCSHQVLACSTNEEFSFSFDDFSGKNYCQHTLILFFTILYETDPWSMISGNTNDANGRRIKTHPIDMVITIATDMILLSTISTGKRQVLTSCCCYWFSPELLYHVLLFLLRKSSSTQRRRAISGSFQSWSSYDIHTMYWSTKICSAK